MVQVIAQHRLSLLLVLGSPCILVPPLTAKQSSTSDHIYSLLPYTTQKTNFRKSEQYCKLACSPPCFDICRRFKAVRLLDGCHGISKGGREIPLARCRWTARCSGWLTFSQGSPLRKHPWRSWLILLHLSFIYLDISCKLDEELSIWC